MNLTDIAATLLDFADAEPMAWYRSLLGTGGSGEWDNMTLSELGGSKRLPSGRMIRKDEWKLIHYHGCEHVMLFNLADDPGELHDLGQDEQYRDIRESLLAELLQGWAGDDIDRSVARIRKRYAPVLRQ